jgi:hypothetical protein
MRKLLWMIMLFGAYIWVMTSGHDDLVLETGKWAYRQVVDWFEDAEVDFQIKQEIPKKKPRLKERRWD